MRCVFSSVVCVCVCVCVQMRACVRVCVSVQLRLCVVSTCVLSEFCVRLHVRFV